jgi:hypothetical protein
LRIRDALATAEAPASIELRNYATFDYPLELRTYDRRILSSARTVNGKRYIILLNADLTTGWAGNLDIGDLHVVALTNVWNGASYVIKRSGSFSRAAVSLAPGELALLEWKTLNEAANNSLERLTSVVPLVTQSIDPPNFKSNSLVARSLAPSALPSSSSRAVPESILGRDSSICTNRPPQAPLSVSLAASLSSPSDDSERWIELKSHILSADHIIEASTNLTRWSIVGSNPFNTDCAWADTISISCSRRFYRVRLLRVSQGDGASMKQGEDFFP